GNPVTVPTPLVKQTLAMGPVASQEAIKMLGTNGGGFFNANSAHPYENPTPFANFVQIFSILIIPAALALVFGHMIGDRRQGIAVLAAMTVAFAIALGVEVSAEQAGNPTLAALALLKGLPDTPVRAHWELTLLLSLGPVLMDVRGYGATEVGAVYTRALELCER
ncbi:potassium-transporting ATPase subunit KdpA, partial [Paraburkholderia sp. SIMBA_009]